MPVPNTFASATSAIPLANLDTNFATPITLGNTAVQLGNTITTINSVTLVTPTINTITSGSGSNLVLQSNNAVTAVTIDTSQNATFAGKVIAGTGGNVMASWTTSGRPSSPVTGQMGYNTTYGGLEVYNGSAWDTITGGPAFSAYMGSSQSISNVTFTKLQLNTVNFDTNSNYNSSSYRFTPTVAGYYQCSAGVSFTTATGIALIDIEKNGSRTLESTIPLSLSSPVTACVSGIIYLNGSTDYIEVYTYQNSGGSLSTGNSGSIYGNYFQAAMVRSA